MVALLSLSCRDGGGVGDEPAVSSSLVRWETTSLSAIADVARLRIDDKAPTGIGWTAEILSDDWASFGNWNRGEMILSGKVSSSLSSRIIYIYYQDNTLDRERELRVRFTFDGGEPVELSLNQPGKLGGGTQTEGDTSWSWPELPAKFDEQPTLAYATHFCPVWDASLNQKVTKRNYTLCYDKTKRGALWVAYPLHDDYTGSGRVETWEYDPKIEASWQPVLYRGYNNGGVWNRGHQIPNADRNAVPEMMAQTYFSTNMTPQIQNGMNGGLWAKLEEAVRNETPVSDTLYVITGSTFRVRGDEEIKTIVNKNDGKTLPVPNYYWKAALKVRRTESGLSEAVTIGFWVPHDDLKGRNYTEFAVPVDSLEALTGFDLFVNLPDKMETAAETNGSWETFCAFSR
jgi:endonuclease G